MSRRLTAAAKFGSTRRSLIRATEGVAQGLLTELGSSARYASTKSGKGRVIVFAVSSRQEIQRQESTLLDGDANLCVH